jgi:ubiquinone/menaquinone biosynthesis C-methylase UbiE
MRVDPSNADALRSWDGDDGAYWTEHDEIFDRSVAGYDAALLAQLRPADRVLDVGCGTGSITRAAARRVGPAGGAVGIDLSSAMLALAERRAAAEGLGTVRFVHGDAQAHDFTPASFDTAVSRNGVMFFGDPVAAFANIARALRPGGRLAVLVWQPLAANEWMTSLMRTVNGSVPHAGATRTGPFSFGDPARVRAVLADAGFTGITVTGLAESIWFGPDAGRAYRFFAGLGPVRAALAGADPGVAERLRELVASRAGPDGVRFGSAMWLVTATRIADLGLR